MFVGLAAFFIVGCAPGGQTHNVSGTAGVLDRSDGQGDFYEERAPENRTDDASSDQGGASKSPASAAASLPTSTAPGAAECGARPATWDSPYAKLEFELALSRMFGDSAYEAVSATVVGMRSGTQDSDAFRGPRCPRWLPGCDVMGGTLFGTAWRLEDGKPKALQQFYVKRGSAFVLLHQSEVCSL